MVKQFCTTHNTTNPYYYDISGMRQKYQYIQTINT